MQVAVPSGVSARSSRNIGHAEAHYFDRNGMTAELAILNKSSVALAADSAVTVVINGVSKVYQSNKLFALGDDMPVGVMIYGNAEFMGVPWGTLINMYRDSTPNVQKRTIGGYAIDFLKFIKDHKVCNSDAEVDNAIQIAIDALSLVKMDVEAIGIYRTREKGRQLTGRERNDLFESVIDRKRQIIDGTRPFGTADLNRLRSVFTMIFPEIDASIGRVLDESLIYKKNRKRFSDILVQICHGSIERQIMSRGYSGVVLAGFGEEEIFPTLVEARIDGFVAGALRAKRGHHHDIGRGGIQAAVIPFAQKEMVGRFMEGIDPAVKEYLKSLNELVYRFSRAGLNTIKALTGAQEKALKEAAEKDVSEYLKELEDFLGNEFWRPIVRVVEHLPKEDLATMAESLVSLTSLKRHVSSEEETVGGPVDVAVVSKGEGFSWVRRKSSVGGA